MYQRRMERLRQSKAHVARGVPDVLSCALLKTINQIAERREKKRKTNSGEDGLFTSCLQDGLAPAKYRNLWSGTEEEVAHVCNYLL